MRNFGVECVKLWNCLVYSPTCDGLLPSCDGLEPSCDDLLPSCDGLLPFDGLQPTCAASNLLAMYETFGTILSTPSPPTLLQWPPPNCDDLHPSRVASYLRAMASNLLPVASWFLKCFNVFHLGWRVANRTASVRISISVCVCGWVCVQHQLGGYQQPMQVFMMKSP